MQYDFDYCIPFVMERSLFIRESLCKEQVHASEIIHTIKDIEVTPGNQDFTSMVIKGRRCQLLTMVSPTGLIVENGLSLNKLANMNRRLSKALNNYDKLAQGQVIN